VGDLSTRGKPLRKAPEGVAYLVFPPIVRHACPRADCSPEWMGVSGGSELPYLTGQKPAKFRAVSPKQDEDHLEGVSGKVKIRVI